MTFEPVSQDGSSLISAGSTEFTTELHHRTARRGERNMD